MKCRWICGVDAWEVEFVDCFSARYDVWRKVARTVTLQGACYVKLMTSKGESNKFELYVVDRENLVTVKTTKRNAAGRSSLLSALEVLNK